MRRRSSRWLALLVIVSAAFAPICALAQSDPAAAGLTGTTALHWSGYVSSGGTYTGVSATWKVPDIQGDMTSAAADATWVGIGGVVTSDLIQTGTEAIPDGAGGVGYHAWFEALPDASQIVPLGVHAGDQIHASLSQDSATGGTWRITLTNVTTGESYSTEVTYASALSSAEWIEEVPAGVGTSITLDRFGSIAFSAASTVENGASISIAGSGAVPLTMTNDAQETVAQPSSVSPDGTSFTVVRTDATSSSMAIGLLPPAGSVFVLLPTDDASSGAAIPAISLSYGGNGSDSDLTYRIVRELERSQGFAPIQISLY